MERYFNKNISLETVAELSGRSLSSFKRDFKKTFNTTPARWIRERRMSWAEQLLRNSGKVLQRFPMNPAMKVCPTSVLYFVKTTESLPENIVLN
ncbi:AraC family transcriptional regulator [Aduncisulcus paluster]|uniref:AraC family transcriptional regulator n=1 Tax=Aduncisulcus paluster TaxID=2918883 RepID=A0ABQ5K9U6_9EUKA|nr:AraC family transcriptional regulator [Aduncisulcus paluster]